VSMFSFYTLPSSVLGHETHTELRAAYMFYTGGVCERRSRAAHGSADTAPLLLLLCCACAVPRCACAVLCPAPTPFPRDTMPPPPVLCFPRYTHPPTHPPPTPPTHPHTHTHTHAVPGPSDLTQLMQDALVTAAAAGYDVFNALDLLQNATFLKARLAACAALFACTRACVRVCVYACVCVRVCVCVCDDAGVTWPARWTCCRPAAPCRRAGVPRVALCFGVQRAALWPPERTHQLTRSRRCCCCPRPPSPRASPAPTCTPLSPLPPPPTHTRARARTPGAQVWHRRRPAQLLPVQLAHGRHAAAAQRRRAHPAVMRCAGAVVVPWGRAGQRVAAGARVRQLTRRRRECDGCRRSADTPNTGRVALACCLHQDAGGVVGAPTVMAVAPTIPQPLHAPP
jgi:hypothetical protein